MIIIIKFPNTMELAVYCPIILLYSCLVHSIILLDVSILLRLILYDAKYMESYKFKYQSIVTIIIIRNITSNTIM